jgi:type VI secretion system protein ImpH
MASPSGPPDSVVSRGPLPERLKSRPWDFRFFQAVRLLQYLQPAKGSVGQFVEPRYEAAHFSAPSSMGFPAAEIQTLEMAEEAPARMEVNFMGLTGPSGELPLVYTAYLMERARAGDSAMKDFLSMFDHRMISLFYRAWEKYRFTVPYERGERGGLKQYLLDEVGLGTAGLQNRQDVSDESLAFYSGLLSQQPRSAVALRQILSDYFEAPVEIVEFVGAWRKLDREGQCQLDDAEFGMGSARLGGGAVVGDEVWDPQSVVRLRIGPLGLARYREFLPTGSAYGPLKALTKFFSGHDLDFEVQLILNRSETPPLWLGEEESEGPRLGWVSWVKSRDMNRDPDDTVLRLWEEDKSS